MCLLLPAGAGVVPAAVVHVVLTSFENNEATLVCERVVVEPLVRVD